MATSADNPLDAPAAIEAPPRQSGKRQLLFALKLIVTVGLMTWIAMKVDWGQFWSELIHINLSIIALVVFLRFAGVWISAVKWRQLLLVHGVRYPSSLLLRWYLVSLFLSQFLPSIIGGDAYRVYKTYRNDTARVVSVLAIFVERASGMAALLVMGFAGAVVSYARTGNDFSGAVTIIGTVVLMAAVLACAAIRWFGLFGRVASLRWCPSPVKSLIGFSGDYRHHPGRVLAVAAISFGFHLNRVFVIWLLIYATGTNVDFGALLIAAAVVNLVGVLPISLAGWGLVEGSFIGVMSLYGLDATTGLTAMLLMRVLILPVAAIGAIAYFRGDPTDAVPASVVTEPAEAVPRE